FTTSSPLKKIFTQEAETREETDGLLTMDDGIVNWGEHTEDEETNHALMAISSSIGKPLYSRFIKTNDFKGVPHPLSGDYTPTPQEEIDESLYVYGKKGPQEPEPNVSDNRSKSRFQVYLQHVYLSTPIKPNEKIVTIMKRKWKRAKFKKQRVYNTVNRVAKPVWTNANRVNHANQFVPKPVQLNGGRPNANSVRPNVNTGRVNVNSVRSNVNTGRTNVNPVRPTVNTGSSNVNTVSSRQKIGDLLLRPQQVIIGGTLNHSNCDSGPTFFRTVNAKGPQGRPKPIAYSLIVECSGHMTGNKDQLRILNNSMGNCLPLEDTKLHICVGTSQTPYSNASEEKDEDVELIVVPSTVKNTEEKAESRKSSTNSKKEEILTEPQQENKASSTDTSEDNPKILAFRRDESVNTGSFDPDDSPMPELEIFHKSETGIFNEASYDEEGVITDFNSLPTEIEVSPTPTLRIHNIHPKSQILGDPKSVVQTRSKVQQKSGAHALFSFIQKQQRNNHKDQHHCLFACFLSQEEPKKISKALQDKPDGFKALTRIVTKKKLSDTIDEDVFMSKQPPGFCDPEHPMKVYKGQSFVRTASSSKSLYATLSKALYGLHQAPRGAQLTRLYSSKGTKRISCWFKCMLMISFLVLPTRLQVKQNKGGIFISQDKYVAEILKKFDLVNVKAAITPMETKVPLTKDEEAIDVDVTPKTSHLNVVKRIFKYLKGKPNLGLWYPRESPFDLEAFSDSDYGGSNLDRKSTTGGCQFLGQRLISWQCKKQTIVATSTTEAEYVAAANCCGQVLWVQNQLLDYGFNFMNTKIHIDNESTICIVKNPVYHSKTKHIEIRHHFIRDCYEKKLISVEKIHTDLNVADLLTKPFDGPRFNYLVVSIVGFLRKPDESAGFAEIVDFLRGSNLRPLLPVMLLVATTNPSACQEHPDVAQSQPSLSTILVPSTSLPQVQSPPPITAPIPASTPTPISETDPEPMEYTFEEQSPVHQHFSPPQEHAQGQLTVDDLLHLVPQLVTRINSLETDLKQTKLTMGSAIVKLVQKVKKLEGILKRRHVVLSDSEEAEPEAQGRKSQDDPLVLLDTRLVYSYQDTVNASGWKTS
ncbi:hypothetical protein Tco_0715911, partial [Tanacetum coccineum]